MVSLAAAGESFVPPGLEDFWHPYIGEGAFALTRPMTLMAFSTVIIVVGMLALTKRLTVVPGKSQMATEGLYGLVRNSIGRDIIGSKDFLRFVPLLFAMFVLILVNNLFGIIPVIQYPTMARIGFPIALTLVVYVVYLFIGMKRRGVWGYIKGLIPPGLPSWIIPLFFFLEILTFFFTRPVTLALRLFGNMFAGHLLLLLMALGGEYMLLHGGPALKVMSIGPFAMGFVLTIFELLVEFLQAYIFTLLAALYIAGSLADEH
ncbi:MAG TPA: F0F1 ATP synthase subunit A [Actinomycetales bacterium]|jgi:F-type H+-transporting ATPase subunit a